MLKRRYGVLYGNPSTLALFRAAEKAVPRLPPLELLADQRIEVIAAPRRKEEGVKARYWRHLDRNSLDFS